jgi:hypothetical protein
MNDNFAGKKYIAFQIRASGPQLKRLSYYFIIHFVLFFSNNNSFVSFNFSIHFRPSKCFIIQNKTLLRDNNELI